MADQGRAQALTMNKKFTQFDWLGFTAQEFPIEIVPKFSMRAVSGMGGSSYGPFSPNYPTEVPLWLALYFRESSICSITTPDFLRVPFLTEVLERDRENDTEYQLLPYHFFEISMQLIKVAKNDIPSVTEVIRLISEIEASRRHKLMRSVGGFGGADLNMAALRLTNLVSFEIEYLRSSLALVVSSAENIETRSQPASALPLVKVATISQQGVTPARAGGATLDSTTPYGDSTIGRPSTVVGGEASEDGGSYGGVGQALAFGGDGGSALGTQLSQQTDLTSVAVTSMTATTVPASDGAPAPKKRRTLRQQ